MIRSRVQMRFRGQYQLMLIIVWKPLNTPSGMARVRLVAMLVSPASVSRDAGPIGQCVPPGAYRHPRDRHRPSGRAVGSAVRR
jgi:hypothetical protein